MPTKDELLKRAKEIIEANPRASKDKVNQYLRIEMGVGLRSDTILRLKAEVASEKPSLAPELYARGSVGKGLNEIYNGWIAAGFLPFEARELTVGHGERYRNFNAQSVFNSQSGEAARRTRIRIIQEQLKAGWTRQQIRDNIIDYYKKSRKLDPWEHIRAEYKPTVKTSGADYRDKVRARAKAKQQRLLRRK